MAEIIEPGEVITPPKPIVTPDPEQSTEDDGRGTSPADVVTPPKSFSGKEHHADIEDYEGPYVITLNGTYATAGKEMAEDLKVEILPTLTPLLTATENGDYEPESPDVGFKKVTVAVPPTPAYEGSYTIVENAVLPTNGKRMTSDLTVNVPSTNSLKKLLDATKRTYYLFINYQGDDIANLISYDDTSEVTDFRNMFQSCLYITGVPLLNTSKGRNFSGMFYACNNIKSIPQFDTSQATNMANAFRECYALEVIPALEVSNVTNLGDVFRSCDRLKEIHMYGMSASFGISASTLFTEAALVEIIGNLADLTGQTPQTLTMGATNLAKLTQAEKDVATAKNWTLA